MTTSISKNKNALRDCPCCGRQPLPPVEASGTFLIGCPKDCRLVDGKTFKEAVKLWNENRFTDK